jgi:two-component system OmpR family response regulator
MTTATSGTVLRRGDGAAPRVLVVDDEQMLTDLLSMALRMEGWDVRTASSGFDALQTARTLEPDAMLLDVMMPDLLDGYQVCARVKADPELKHIRVVMLTARGQVTDIAAGEAAGADAYLVKPFSPLELIERVEAIAAEAAA